MAFSADLGLMEQVGPAQFWHQLKAEAPHYAKFLPALPRLLHDRLLRDDSALREDVRALVQAQQCTNRLLQGVVFGALGFVAGLVAMAVYTWW